MIKRFARALTPPIIWNGLHKYKQRSRRSAIQHFAGNPTKQDLDLYWDPQFAKELDTWGTGNVWHEILFMLANCSGMVLDIACGTGKTIEILRQLPQIEVHGCDISDMLIEKAIERGVPRSQLMVCDATHMTYANNQFDYSYSIGSLEHFTDEGTGQFIRECYRITRYKTFHMVPASRSGSDEGWIKSTQSYFNNSPDWWRGKFSTVYEKVYILNSLWHDRISNGIWIVAEKNPGELSEHDGGKR